MSPSTAFLRALLVPGWGHASIGEHTRGGFYFVAGSASAWMMVRTRSRLNAAHAVRDMRLSVVADRQAALGVTDPGAIATAQNADALVQDARALAEARAQQFQDWLALGIFLVFLSSADAFVTAHLQDFPEPVAFQLRPSGSGMELGFSVLFGGSGNRR